jgi:nicotinamidase-related amidase
MRRSAVRDAFDRGYYVTLVADACVGRSPEQHAHTIAAMRGYARIRDTDEVIGELKAFSPLAAAG